MLQLSRSGAGLYQRDGDCVKSVERNSVSFKSLKIYISHLDNRSTILFLHSFDSNAKGRMFYESIRQFVKGRIRLPPDCRTKIFFQKVHLHLNLYNFLSKRIHLQPPANAGIIISFSEVIPACLLVAFLPGKFIYLVCARGYSCAIK